MWVNWNHHLAKELGAYVKECGGSGDSQLFAISEALKPEKETSLHWLREQMVRALDQWSEEDVETQLEQYRFRLKKQKLGGIWNPIEMDKEGLKSQILKPNISGNPYDFEEDEFTLQLLAEGLGLNFWVFSHSTGKVWHTKSKYPRTICLLYRHLPHFQHYQLLGFSRYGSEPQAILLHKELLHSNVSFVDHLPSHLNIRSHYTVNLKQDLYLPKFLLKLSQWYNFCCSGV